MTSQDERRVENGNRPPDPDAALFERVHALAGEEEGLYAAAADGGMDDEQLRRLREVETQLDQLYDLLHQRQGRRDAGLGPQGTGLRPAAVVEGYEQ